MTISGWFRYTAAAATFLLVACIGVPSFAQQLETDDAGREFVAGRLVVKLRGLAADADRNAAARADDAAPANGKDVAERLTKWGALGTERVFTGGAGGIAADARAAVAGVGAAPGEVITVELPAGSDVAAAQADFAASPDVEWAEPAYIFRLQFIPNDPLFTQQWGLHNPGGGPGQLQLADADVDAPEAWDVTQGTGSTVIAVIDTGVDLDHPDLDAKIWQNPSESPGDGNGDGRPGFAGFDDDGDGLIDEDSANRQPGDAGYSNDLVADDDENGYSDDFRGWNFLINDNNAQDDQGHGTHCAGIAAAETNNGVGIAGACPGCKVMALKAFTSSGFGDNVSIARAIEYAAANGAAVISMSFGSTTESLLVKQALESAYATSLLVAAAGNNGGDPVVLPMYPAEHPFVIGVGASDVAAGEEIPAAFSNPLSTDVHAPGVNIRSTVLNDSYAAWSGTSMAAPLVAGIAGLLRSHLTAPPWDVDLWVGQIRNAADGIAPPAAGNARANALDVLSLVPQPQLQLQGHEVQDPAGNGDGVADAGETVDLRFTVGNTWGAATGISATLSSSSPYVTILDGTALFGNLAPQATGQNNVDKITIQISPAAPNNAELALQLTATAANGGAGFATPFFVPVRRGQTIGGGISSNTTLAADTEYIVTGNMVVAAGVTLTIEEGARILMSPNALITVHGTLIADGSGGDPIVFTANQPATEWAGILITHTSPGTTFGPGQTYAGGNLLRNIVFEKADGFQLVGGGSGGVSCLGCPALHAAKPLLVEDSEFRDNTVSTGYAMIGGYGGSVLRRIRAVRNRTANGYALIDGYEGLALADDIRIEDSIIVDNVASQWTINSDKVARTLIAFNESQENLSSATLRGAALSFNHDPVYSDDCLIENVNEDASVVHLFARGGAGTIPMGGNFWDAATVPGAKATILDFEDGFSGPTIDVSPILASSSPLCPAHLSSAIVAPGSVVGAGVATFTLTFNRAMDTGVEPAVTFGVAAPHTQRVVDGAWSNPTTWVGTYNVTVFTGEGIHTLRVAGARGATGTEAPTDTRFGFTVSTTGLSGVALQASGEIGRVDLTFNPVDEPDLAGYNVYRADSPGGAYTKLNAAIVLGTTYSDFTAPEGVTKYYVVRAVRTDLSQSDASVEASAAALDGTGPSLTHTPIAQVSDAAPGLTVQANASDPSGMGLVRLRYKRTGEPSFVAVTMANPSGSLYSANIPGSFITLAGIDYYVEANDALGNQTFSGSAAMPHHVLVYECTTAAECADDGSACTVTTCSGGLCTHPPGNSGVTCRASVGECDLVEACDGVSGSCPADVLRSAGTACTADGETCTADVCNGASAACTHPAGNSGVTCRASSGECDVAETCNGASTTCPADGFVAAGTGCADDGSVCTADACNGSGACVHTPGNAGTTCRAAIGVCDVAESCNGTSPSCPANGFVAAGTACPDDGSACTTDACDGSGACVHPAGNAGTTCRASGGACDVAETCNGSSTTCPTDGFVGAGVVCRASIGVCDLAELCDGATAACPADTGSPDGDGDAVCDAADPCTNTGGLQDFKVRPKSKTLLGKINNDPVAGNDTLTLLGVFDLAAGHAFAEVNPQAAGARLLLRNAAGGVELDVTLPGGLYAGSGTRGWKRNASGTTWTYLDKTTDGTLASAHGGIFQLQILDRGKRVPREVMIKAKGKGGTYPIAAADSPIEAIVVLGGPAAGQAGLCGESDYAAANCAFNGPGTTLKCLK